MASTRQTLSMDCGSSMVTTWSNSKTTDKISLRAVIQNEDSLDLELGASASHVDKNRVERHDTRCNGNVVLFQR